MKKNANKDLFLLSIFTLITVTLWIFFELLKTIKTSTVKPNVQEVITPLDSKLNTDIFDIIASKNEY